MPSLVREFQVDRLHVAVYEDRASMGKAAAAEVAKTIAQRQKASKVANVIFAAAPSQNEFLENLAADKSVDWSKVTGLHMDEYLGISPDHPASFRRYLHEHLFDKVGLAGDQLKLIPGEEAGRPLKTCVAYEDILMAFPPDLVCGGIGENGHIAFNDPPVADFLDPVHIKIVRLDHACRVQQVNDGCFATLDEVPTHAFTLTISALLSAPVLSIVVPGPRKADAVRATLQGPIDEACPASVLRRHVGAKLYLDLESAKYVL